MADNMDTIGVKAVWDGDDFQKGAKDYNKAIDQANGATKDFADETARSSSKAARDFGRNSKKLVKSAVDIQSIFETTARAAGQFGNALQDAAAGRDVQRAFKSLARASGVNADELISNMKRASRGTVAEMDILKAANQALLAGGADLANELPRLFEIARASAVATGKDVGMVFETLVRGIIKGSPLLIDNAEIYIEAGKAVDAYAESVGKTTEELSATEKQQATLSAVLDQGSEFITTTGTDVDTASDAFSRWDARIQDATQATLTFLNDVLGPLGPALKGVADIFQQVNPLLQTFVLLKQAGVAGGIGGLFSGGGAGAIGALGPVLGVTSSALAGVGVGVAGYELGLRKIFTDLPPTTEVVDKSTKVLGYWAQEAINGKEAADEWMRAQLGMPTLAQQAAESQAEHNAALQELLGTIGTSTESYAEYRDKVREINGELAQGEQAVALMTQRQFELRQAFIEGNATIERQKEILAELRAETSMGGLGGILQGVSNDAFSVAVAAREVAAELDETARASEFAAYEQNRLDEAFQESTEGMQDARQKLQDIYAQQYAQIESAETSHQQRMEDIQQKANDARADAARDLSRSLADAESQRNSDLQDAAREHAQAVQDIERDYRRRLRDIQQEYSKTVREAAIERDALAILQARERRDEETADAEEDRRERLQDENQNFAERQQQIQQAYTRQVEAARQAYQHQLQEQEQALARELQNERQSQQQKLAEIRAGYEQELAEQQLFYSRFEANYRAHLSRLTAVRGGTGREGGLMGSRTSGGIGMQEGFDGVVTGPQTFHVEPGVTEYVYASGDLGERQPVMSSPSTTQTQSMRAMVGGRLGMSVNGLGSQLMGRIGDQLKETITAGVLDELAFALEASL